MPEELYTKEEYQPILLKTLGNSPKLRIIDFFLDNSLSDFTKKEVIEALGMSKQTKFSDRERLSNRLLRVSDKEGPKRSQKGSFKDSPY